MTGPLGELTKTSLLIVGALFPIVNPIGSTPIFLSLTNGLSSQGRAILARMIAINGAYEKVMAERGFGQAG